MKNAHGFSIAAAVAFALIAGPAFGQIVDVQTQGGKIDVRAPGVRVEGQVPGGIRDRDNNTAFRPWRSSKIVGAEVKNSQDESLGTVNDLILDDQGHAHYLILAHGGVLGVGQKMFAIPLKAVTFNKTEDDGHFVRLNVQESVLEKADSFTSDKWPDFNDMQYRKSVDDFYLNSTVNTPNTGVNVEVK